MENQQGFILLAQRDSYCCIPILKHMKRLLALHLIQLFSALSHLAMDDNINWILNILFVALILFFLKEKKCQFRYLRKLVISSRGLLY